MPVKLRNIFKEPVKLTLKAKMILSLSAIAVILLTSSIISVIEYKIMSTYVSDLIADNIRSINMPRNWRNRPTTTTWISWPSSATTISTACLISTSRSLSRIAIPSRNPWPPARKSGWPTPSCMPIPLTC